MSKEIINLYTGMPYSERAKEERLKVARLPASDPIILKKLDKLYASNDVLIVKAATGCGKGLVIAPHIMQLENPEKDKINKCVITEPRSMNTQVANYLKIVLDADIVDFAYRFNNNLKVQTRLAFLTDGFLLNFFYRDPTLPDYKCIIIDEVHERNISIDMILTFLKILLQKGIKKKVVLLSATIDPQFYKNYFGGKSAVLEIEGINKPVKDIWLQKKDDYVAQAIEEVSKLISAGLKYTEVVVVFLASINELKTFCKTVALLDKPIDCYEIHSKTEDIIKDKLTNDTEQKFRIIVGTNSIESGVTLTGVKYVIDSGRKYENSFDAVEEMNVMNTIFISKSEAWQRRGRSGRTSDGICIHLYSEIEFKNEFPDYKPAEILSQEISPMILNLYNIYEYNEIIKFLDTMPNPPTEEQRKYAFKLLNSLGLIQNNKITDIGRIVGKIPLEPEQALCLLYARAYKVDYQICLIMSMLSLDPIIDNYFVDIREGPLYKDYMRAKDKWMGKGTQGELFIFMELLTEFMKNKDGEKWCKNNFLQINKFIKAKKIFYKLREQIKDISFNINVDDINNERKKISKCFEIAYKNNILELESFNIYKVSRPVQYVEIKRNKNLKLGKKMIFINITKIKGQIYLGGLLNI